VWQLHWTKLGRAICQAFELDAKPAVFGLLATRQVGSWSADAVPVILTIQNQPHQLRFVIAELGNRLRQKFILLAPTADLLDATSQELLANAGACFFSLTAHLRLTRHGTLEAIHSPGELFVTFSPQAALQLTRTRLAAPSRLPSNWVPPP